MTLSTHPKAVAARARYAANVDAERERGRARKKKLRRDAIEAYGGRCACCGEDTYEFLLLDHIADDGSAHRAALRATWSKNRPPGATGGNGAGTNTYRWLKKHGWPRGLVQVLCSNCNFAKSMGGCPHNVEAVAGAC